jgi:hypothetical protein
MTPRPSISPSASATPDPNQQAKQAALAPYTGMWTDYANAAQTADCHDQRLTQHATDGALVGMLRNLYDLRRDGFVAKGVLENAPTVAAMIPPNAPTQVDIKDCASDVHWLKYVAATGKLMDAIPGGHRLITARVAKQLDRWRVTSYEVQAEGSC